jgi:transcription elongation factor Elf1
MSNSKLDATIHGGVVNPGVAVHVDVIYQAVCHVCGWEGQTRVNGSIAEHDAYWHRCGNE